MLELSSSGRSASRVALPHSAADEGSGGKRARSLRGAGWSGAAALITAGATCLLYRSTLLPGFDLGDTPSFQTMAGSPVVTPRDGYPLYFAIGRLFVAALDGDRAYALNVASAVEGAIACGILVVVAAALSGSVLAAVGATLLFAGSYTFWSQTAIAEVYALHVLLVALTLLLLVRWAEIPTTGRLASFFGAYALSFGNHLSMVLMAPAYTAFLLASAPRGWRSMFAPRVIAMAIAIAVVGALQYSWNFSALWLAPAPPVSFIEALRIFWFDVTKSDWRDTMVLAVPVVMGLERLRMYAFDVAQQFGWIGLVLAAAGVVQLARAHKRRLVLVLGIYLVNLLFALGYNVGDSHVFFLPSHVMLALLMAPGIVLFGTVARARGVIAVVAIFLAATRIYENHPPLDRSEDVRPAQVLHALTAGLDDRHAVLLSEMNWQVQNGLTYFAKEVRPEVAYAPLSDVILYTPALVRDNLAIGREIAVTDAAKVRLESAYGPLFQYVRDSRVPETRVSDLTGGLPDGAPYVLTVLRPSREFSIDPGDFETALRQLTGGSVSGIADADYNAVAGLVGQEPRLLQAANHPFRRTLSLGRMRVDVRMESWLAFDTIRRMGFGHVIAARHHALILERGVSFVAFDTDGRVLRSGYSAGIFAPTPRYLIWMP
jgi:hypothetical protein